MSQQQQQPACILTVAGSDSGGGAGIQADLKTFTVRGTYGMSVITALTAQNTLGVQGVFEVPIDFIAKQLDSVLSDLPVNCVKTGMLSSKEIVSCVASKLAEYKVENIVVDPVMVATSGDVLLKEEAIESITRLLLPLATIVTPNIPEASKLAHLKDIDGVEKMKEAAKEIAKFGPKYVLVKGGHLGSGNGSSIDTPKTAVDVLYDCRSGEFHLFEAEMIPSNNTHGTGCTLAACIAAEIGKGCDVVTAVKNAKDFISRAISISAHARVGNGHGPLLHHAVL